ncbi:MAG: hypothetical protein LUG16_04910, partial [Candidatus Gastranaerophilales bacterium]|nr:hypothetical protein [Candidatus Gastranaerophilales bacterium]
IYTHEVLIKYFNTFEAAGFKIKKIKTRYKLLNAIFNINLSKQEEEILYKVIDNIPKLYNDSLEENLYNFFDRAEKFINISYPELFEKKLSAIKHFGNPNTNSMVPTLKKLAQDSQLVNISYKKNDNIIELNSIVIKEIIEKQGDIYVTCYNKSLGRNKKVAVSSILSLKQLPNKTDSSTYMNPVVFELYGRLASVYKIRKYEKVIDISNNRIVVSNSGEDKDTLLLRILKYGENCKIIKPLSVQNDFITLIDNMIKNLEAE